MYLSPWLVYLILQLDSISMVVFVLSVLSSIVCFIVWMVGLIGTECGTDRHNWKNPHEAWIGLKRAGISLTVVSLLLMLGNALIPSTKTMAAVVVLPAIVNNQNVQKEAGELYQLAKQGLANAVGNIGEMKAAKASDQPEQQEQKDE